eukprot:5367526-Pyramimonas_sp.AAC.1
MAPPAQERASRVHARIQRLEATLPEELDKLERLEKQAEQQRKGVREAKLALNDSDEEYRKL